MKHYPLSGDDINKALKNVRGYKGWFSSDQLPSKITAGSCAVINLDVSTSTGSHWVAYYILKDICIYFDSFGCRPSDQTVAFLKRSGKKIVYSNNEYQALNSIACGPFVIFFILWFYNNASSRGIYKFFYKVLSPNKLIENDKKVWSFYQEIVQKQL